MIPFHLKYLSHSLRIFFDLGRKIMDFKYFVSIRKETCNWEDGVRTLIILLIVSLALRVNSKEVGKERENRAFLKRFSAVPGNS